MAETMAQQAAAPAMRPRIVGVGASAGGLKAFREFLSALPARPDVAVVLVLHLDPTRASTISEMLAPDTRFRVVQAAEGMRVTGGTVYVIAPNTTLTVKGGAFHTVTPRVGGTVRQCVDYLFASLAA